MRYLSFIEFLNEKKHPSLFPEYDKQFPDNPYDIASEFAYKFEYKGNMPDCNIEWEDILEYFDDNLQKGAVEALKHSDMSHYEEGIEYIFDSIIDYLTDVKGEVIDEDFDKDELLEKWDLFSLMKEMIEYSPDNINLFLSTDFYDRCYKWIADGEGFVYRTITLSDKIEDIENLNFKGVGIYWAYNEQAAEAHWAEKDYNTVILKAKVRPCDINKENTLYKSLYSLSEEQEIELNEGSVIELQAIEIESTHPIIRKMEDNDKEYYSSIGVDYHKVKSNRGMSYIEFEEPIKIKV